MQITIQIDSIEELNQLHEALIAIFASSTMEAAGSELQSLGLSVRSLNALHFVGCRTIEKLCAYTEKELLNIPNLGRMAVGNIKEKLKNRGLSLDKGDLKM